MNQGALSFNDNTKTMFNQLIKSYSFLESGKYSRIVLELDSDTESDYTNEVVKNIRKETKSFYQDALLVGNTINAKDLKS